MLCRHRSAVVGLSRCGGSKNDSEVTHFFGGQYVFSACFALLPALCAYECSDGKDPMRHKAKVAALRQTGNRRCGGYSYEPCASAAVLLPTTGDPYRRIVFFQRRRVCLALNKAQETALDVLRHTINGKVSAFALYINNVGNEYCLRKKYNCGNLLLEIISTSRFPRQDFYLKNIKIYITEDNVTSNGDFVPATVFSLFIRF